VTELTEPLYRPRHSAAHVLAHAVLDLFPDAKLGIGPPVADGFYYDFDLGRQSDGTPRTFSPEDLQRLEARMREIIAENGAFEYAEVTADEARTQFRDQPYKLELLEGLLAGTLDENGEETDAVPRITTYRIGQFLDLCRGPHVDRAGEIAAQALKLTSVSGAYWRGDERRPMLQRIYGTLWNTAAELDAYLKRVEEAKKRDHRKLGRDLDIYVFDEEVGAGLPLWLPNGGILIEQIEQLAKDTERAAGYHRVRTPAITKDALFVRSGHLPYFAESMYPPMELDGTKYYIKPMNCPFHHKIFAARLRSYRDLPLRLAEYGTCYRYERSGDLFGLMRVRSFQMNDAHIYCTEEQFQDEFLAVVGMYRQYFALLGIDRFVMRLSTHHRRGLGKKYIDNERLWLHTEDMVRRAMTHGGVPFVEAADEAAFYGPKIDVQIWSATGREFTLATNQVDFAQPERFGLTYVDAAGRNVTPLCIHRAPLSTHERLIGFLLEHYAGAFPPWLAPEQVRIIPIADKHLAYAERVLAALQQVDVRASVDAAGERMNAKIRQAQLLKVPYMLVLGDREAADGTVSLRRRDGSKTDALALDAFVSLVRDKVARRSLEL
jgi:threonyl-tRNA synthetase